MHIVKAGNFFFNIFQRWNNGAALKDSTAIALYPWKCVSAFVSYAPLFPFSVISGILVFSYVLYFNKGFRSYLICYTYSPLTLTTQLPFSCQERSLNSVEVSATVSGASTPDLTTKPHNSHSGRTFIALSILYLRSFQIYEFDISLYTVCSISGLFNQYFRYLATL